MQTSSANGSNQEQHLRAQLELLKNHDAATQASAAAANNLRNALIQPAPARPSNGYDALSTASQDVARILSSKPEEAHIHPDLRARPNHAPTASMMPIAAPSGHEPGASGGLSGPSIAPAPPSSAMSDDGGPNDGHKAKRELSQSKRAAQNRAAQRAFRQRKEGYIKKLEQQVREYMEMEVNFKTMQAENYALREYVIHLQSRMLETQGDRHHLPSRRQVSATTPPTRSPWARRSRPSPRPSPA
ncbi:hypothetical protein G7046_g10096 [Stylonectria norvegica]|nr:hypothetical protein G7046_g10096 [Stylonectria norvegica]